VDAVSNVTIARRGWVVVMTARFCVGATIPALPLSFPIRSKVRSYAAR
jgi:hypothetical protein